MAEFNGGSPLDSDERARIFDASLKGFRRRDEGHADLMKAANEGSKAPVTWGHINHFIIPTITKGIREHVVAPLRKRIEGLEQRLDAQAAVIKELAARPQLRDCGVYELGASYQQGDAVTYAGSLFIAQKDAPAGRPELSSDWRLAVKRGRDGRDAKK